MSRYFGTDGFRGEANVKLTAELAFKTGRFVGAYYGIRHKDEPRDKSAENGTKCRAVASGMDSHCRGDSSSRSGCAGGHATDRVRIVIGEDTRHSGAMLRYALAAGLTASGADAYILGVTTTPAVSYIARTDGFDCGIMISASHNPYYDNGLKVISGDGTKLGGEETELAERYLSGESGELPYAVRESIGRIYDYSEGREHYKRMLIDVAIRESIDLRGKRIALDCAHGSASTLAPEIFRKLGADIMVIGDEPDGFNINAGVGSTHMARLREIVREGGYYMGFAYDGDADRCLACDENGAEINGDMLIYVNALDMKSRGILNGNAVTLTVMSNLGAFKAFEREGISFEQTAVGDRYVWERMCEKHISLGGEQSGHIIFASDATTGDGILTSLKTLAALKRLGKKPSDIVSECAMYPQCLKNVRVRDKDEVASHPDVMKAVKEMEEKLQGRGRVLLRKSGTEPVVRVMAEADSEELCEEICGHIVSVIADAGLCEEA